MGKVTQKAGSAKSGKVEKGAKKSSRKSGVQKAISKSRSKQTKAQIEKLNSDLSTITSIHQALSAQGQAPKEVNALDARSLREGMEKDQKTKLQSEKAEKDLASQLELITGMAL